jgi:hemerythrin HHE cation binding domain protein
MNYIDTMVFEHANIKRMLMVVRAFCYKLYNKEYVDFADVDQMIDFIKNYADKHHHGKEELKLFNKMVQHLGPAAQKLVTNGMLVEHDMGRFYIQQLQEAVKDYQSGNKEAVLDIIANSISYTHLLDRHIQKENDIVYPFAQKNFNKEISDEIQKECDEFEENANQQGFQDKYILLLEQLENKYQVGNPLLDLI